MLDENPYKNLLIKDNVIKVCLSSISEISPNTIKDAPIKNMPETIKFLLPKILIIFPTNGEQNMTATEYVANI